MNAFTPENSPLMVLMFLGTGLATTGCAALAALLWFRRRREWARRFAVLAVLCPLAYGLLLVAVSLASDEQVLGAGGHKYFCEMDCHLAYSVESVRTAKSLGAPPETVGARGRFYVVTVRTWFDENTTSSRRPRDLALAPAPREVVVVDDTGRRYGPSLEAATALTRAGVKSTPLTEPLRPGESYATELVFDLPEDARNPRLLIATAGLFPRFIIGHDSSLFHSKILFRLEPRAESAYEAWPGRALTHP